MVSITNKEKFVLLVGEHGAILCLFIGKKLEKRLFAPGTSVGDRREFNALLQKHPGAPLSVMLDILDQNYTQHTFPAVSSFAIDKLVKKRIERDLDPNDLNGALSLGRESDGRKDWRYLLVSVTRTEPVNEWLDYVTSLPNPFQGIYLLPIETASLVKRLPLMDKEAKAQDSDWHLVVSHHKVSGVRQTVIYKGKTIFSRLILQGKENMPELLAGFIEQETLNTIEYLARLNFNEDSKLNITIVVSDEIKQHLVQHRMQNHHVELLTPNEMSKAFGYQEISEANDKFADIFFAAQFLNSKAVLKLNTRQSKILSTMSMALQYSTLSMWLIVPPLVLLTLYTSYEIFATKSGMQSLENEKASIESKWKAVQEASQYNIDESSKITQTAELHNGLQEAELSPNPLFQKFKQAILQDAVVKSIQWDYNHSFSKTNNAPNRVNAKFNLEFLNKGSNIDELFNNFDAFSRRLMQAFSDYEITHTKLPERITLGERSQIINIQVTISSKSEARR